MVNVKGAGSRKVKHTSWQWCLAMLALAGCGSVADSPRGAPAGGVLAEVETGNDLLDQRISAACQYDQHHLVPEPLIELLEEHHGDLETTSYICDGFCWPLYCWKKASQLNPEIREGVCDGFLRYLSEDYKDDGLWNGTPEEWREFLEGHDFDCRLGIPQFIY